MQAGTCEPCSAGTQNCVAWGAEVRTPRSSSEKSSHLHNPDAGRGVGGAGLPHPRCQTFLFPRSLFITAAELNFTRNSFKEHQRKHQETVWGPAFLLQEVEAVRVPANGLGLEPEAQAALSGPSAAPQGSGAEGSVTGPQRSWACYLVTAVGCTGAACRAQQLVHPLQPRPISLQKWWIRKECIQKN